MFCPKKIFRFVAPLLVSSVLISCSHQLPYQLTPTNNAPLTVQYSHDRAMFIQSYVDAMADAIIVNGVEEMKMGRIAVGSITMIDSFQLAQDKTHHLNFLGLQIQESLMTALLKRKYRVVEFRRSNDILIRDNYDQMLSREIEALNDKNEFHYFLTGTLKYQDNGAIVNLRMIDLTNNEVVSATTKLVPNDVFWPKNRVVSHNGLLYRNGSAAY